MGIGKKIKRTVLLPKSIVEEVNKFDISPTQRSCGILGQKKGPYGPALFLIV